MKNLDSIPHTLNGIFHKLNNLSNITITWTRTSGFSETQYGNPGFTIHEVSGFKTPAEYYHYLVSLCASVRLTIVKDLHGMEPNEQGSMLLEAFNRVGILLEKVSTIILPSELTGSKSSKHLFLRGFNNVTIFSTLKQTTTPATDNRSLLIQLHPYACQLKKAISVLSNQLISMASLLRFHHHHQQNGNRLNYKNHFNNSSPETRSLWDTKISERRKYIRKLIILN